MSVDTCMISQNLPYKAQRVSLFRYSIIIKAILCN